MVVPAHAGVILLPLGVASLYSRRPRTRGGHPPMWQTFTAYGSSSPHTRGSSVRRLSLIIVAAVVPAHAGVIRAHVVPGGGGLRRPRTRGGHPTEFNGLAVQFSSSPHTRGSSSQSRTQSAATRVVPAHAGVIRPGGSPGNATSGRPRTRGGHPSSTLSNVAAIQSSPHTRGSSYTGVNLAPFPDGRPRTRGGHPRTAKDSSEDSSSSPHTRGSSDGADATGVHGGVVPAHAGVIPCGPHPHRSRHGRPRTRGGHPLARSVANSVRSSSPHTRGSSRTGARAGRGVAVVPAHAGVILHATPHAHVGPRRPRTRGGHPSSTLSNVAAIQSSPHTRGSSGQPRPHQHGYDVVPAHAGVIPPTRPGPTRAGSRPRTRGGHPQRPQHRDQRRPSSPHTRGTSVCDDHHQRTRRVVPAHAGVIPR